VTAALEIQRTNKVIGASLEAAPTLFVTDSKVKETLQSVPFHDICITSAITITDEGAPDDAFALPEIDGMSVTFDKATGEKCQRCWKVLPDVGSHTHDGVCGRCDTAL
ncbi:MAG TPA: isoleucine--tRNA ligase, partial [Gammaproteobacteria bacterium]|nr:isoleucine--tRNA ligase [Gammaproteobacteria bacterium]